MVNDTVKSLTAGAIAGSVSRTCTAPLERLKIMMAIDVEAQKYGSVSSAMRVMLREEGVLAMWKGNLTNVARIAPYSAIQFYGFDYLSARFQSDESTMNPVVARVLAGGLAGCLSTVICFPLDVVRTFLTVQTSGRQYNGIFDAFRKIYRERGVRGFYQGLFATLLGIAPYVGINFATFHTLKQWFLPEPSHALFDVFNLGLGCTAGMTAATITYPLELLRRRMILSGNASAGLPRYRHTGHCAMMIFRKEGVRGFYKGLIPCYLKGGLCGFCLIPYCLKVAPSMAINFAVYERLRHVFDFHSQSKR